MIEVMENGAVVFKGNTTDFFAYAKNKENENSLKTVDVFTLIINEMSWNLRSNHRYAIIVANIEDDDDIARDNIKSKMKQTLNKKYSENAKNEADRIYHDYHDKPIYSFKRFKEELDNALSDPIKELRSFISNETVSERCGGISLCN